LFPKDKCPKSSDENNELHNRRMYGKISLQVDLFIFNYNFAEHQAYSLTTRSTTSLQDHIHNLADGQAVDGAQCKSGSDLPDMGKCDTSEFTSPAKSIRHCTEEGQEHVAAILSSMETLEGQVPHTFV
jgi:hypothetical protein